MNTLQDKLKAFERILTIMDELRTQCPWDKKQTIESLRNLTIEETYELADAILKNDTQEIKKELGDVLLHIIFYARIASETNDFDIADVINSLCDKLIHRHPHIYSNTKADTVEEVKENWEKLKLKEKGNTSVLGGVPTSLPALIKATRIQEKARAVGFDWNNKADVWAKVQEELQEFVQETDPEKQQEEFGDVLFSLVNYARFINISPEDALEKTNRKFIQRFQYIEEQARNANRSIDSLSLQEMEAHWQAAKHV
ncbi:MAG: nucleoside triphosphate pyrophosphohydrolase [Bacteroidia bacterium]|jgi:MazG family protein